MARAAGAPRAQGPQPTPSASAATLASSCAARATPPSSPDRRRRPISDRPRLLLTRPADGIARFAPEAEAAGFAVMAAPMLEIAACRVDPATFDGVQAVLITSRTAAPLLAAATRRRDLTVLAVGDATAAAARAAGFARVESADGDVDALARLAAARLDPAAGPLVHAAGAARAGDLAAALAPEGFRVEVVTLYEAMPARGLPPAAQDAIRQGEIDYAAFFSPQTARTFVRLAMADGSARGLARTTAVALSANVDAALEGPTWRRRLTADRPTGEALLNKLVASAFGATPENGAGQPG